MPNNVHQQESYKGRTPDENLVLAEQLAKQNGGMLPSPYWLQKNGYHGIAEHIATAEQLAKQNGGVLPSYRWLIKNGYNGLDQCMRKNPELFQHIKQESYKGRTPDGNLVLAEQLAKQNGGMLPSPYWLQKNGYHGIAEHIATAEQLAKQNDGVLPSPRWLQKNGYNGLDQCMRKNPELFKHIKQAIRNSHGELKYVR